MARHGVVGFLRLCVAAQPLRRTAERANIHLRANPSPWSRTHDPMKRFIALACLALLAACSSGADVAEDPAQNDSTALDAITGRAEKNARERLDKAEKAADKRAADAEADAAP
jgi:hypothetical protein